MENEKDKIIIAPKEGLLADYFDEADKLGLKGDDFGEFIAKRLNEVGTTEPILIPEVA